MCEWESDERMDDAKRVKETIWSVLMKSCNICFEFLTKDRESLTYLHTSFIRQKKREIEFYFIRIINIHYSEIH
jgi:hypothetical protein